MANYIKIHCDTPGAIIYYNVGQWVYNAGKDYYVNNPSVIKTGGNIWNSGEDSLFYTGGTGSTHAVVAIASLPGLKDSEVSYEEFDTDNDSSS